MSTHSSTPAMLTCVQDALFRLSATQLVIRTAGKGLDTRTAAGM